MAIKDWIPRSRWFYIATGSAATTTYYLWWDRHQSDLAQRLFEQEAATRFGSLPVTPTSEPIRVTVLMAAADSFEMAERRRLFRQHVARMLLKAGIDWQVVEVNEAVLGKRLNEARLDSAEHKPLDKFPREPLVTALASNWARGVDDQNIDDGDVKDLMKSYTFTSLNRTFLRSALVALDSRTLDCLQSGVKKALEDGPHVEPTVKKSTWWPFGRSPTHIKPQANKLTTHFVDVPNVESTLLRIARFFNKREETMKLCKESLEAIQQIHSQHQ